MSDTTQELFDKISIGITWCLAWGNERKPKCDPQILDRIRHGSTETSIPEEASDILQQVRQLRTLTLPEQLSEIRDRFPNLWNQKHCIGLVYGGATKIKQYVFEAAKLPDVRGASAILDRINLVDLPAFFNREQSHEVTQWLDNNFPGLKDALIPQLIIYSTGGNILAFCPAAFIDDLANAIEKRYTEETLTANSCAVGDTFKLLELRLGLLREPIETTPWLDWYRQKHQHPLVRAYFGDSKHSDSLSELFQNRKNFNELVGKLTADFNKRRNGNDTESRPSRRYPPVFETHPLVRRDENERRSAVTQVTLPNEPWFSETLARKRRMGEIAKKEFSNDGWWTKVKLDWNPGEVDSWVAKFKQYLDDNPDRCDRYYSNTSIDEVIEAKTLDAIGSSSDGFVGFIYADGNNMGGYIQSQIKSPQDYAKFSRDIFEATEKSVYRAIADCLQPQIIENLGNPDSPHKDGEIVHPFEIVTIGGDDVLLIVPANKALDIAHKIGVEFEQILSENPGYRLNDSHRENLCRCHRYSNSSSNTPRSKCQLSISSGVLITSYNTPIYYADRLVSQLLKSAKEKAKDLKKYGYCGGTVDFLILKSVTMISSKIKEFRKQALEIESTSKKLRMYAAPYTLHELGGLLKTAQALIQSNFPRSQLYQLRSILERGRRTAILNYRYFRVRLKDKQHLLEQHFEKAWCLPKDENNNGNLAPWMSVLDEKGSVIAYETIWRDLVDIYPFVEERDEVCATEEMNKR